MDLVGRHLVTALDAFENDAPTIAAGPASDQMNKALHLRATQSLELGLRSLQKIDSSSFGNPLAQQQAVSLLKSFQPPPMRSPARRQHVSMSEDERYQQLSFYRPHVQKLYYMRQHYLKQQNAKHMLESKVRARREALGRLNPANKSPSQSLLPEAELSTLTDEVLRFDSSPAGRQVEELVTNFKQSNIQQDDVKSFVMLVLQTKPHPLASHLRGRQRRIYDQFCAADSQNSLFEERICAEMLRALKRDVDEITGLFEQLYPELLRCSDGDQEVERDDVVFSIQTQVEDVFFSSQVWGMLRRAVWPVLGEKEENLKQRCQFYIENIDTEAAQVLPEEMLPFDASADPFEECIAQLKALPIEIGPNSKLNMLEKSSQAIIAAACAVYQQQHGKELQVGADVLAPLINHVILCSGRFALLYETRSLEEFLDPNAFTGMRGYNAATWQTVVEVCAQGRPAPVDAEDMILDDLQPPQ